MKLYHPERELCKSEQGRLIFFPAPHCFQRWIRPFMNFFTTDFLSFTVVYQTFFRPSFVPLLRLGYMLQGPRSWRPPRPMVAMDRRILKVPAAANDQCEPFLFSSLVSLSRAWINWNWIPQDFFIAVSESLQDCPMVHRQCIHCRLTWTMFPLFSLHSVASDRCFWFAKLFRLSSTVPLSFSWAWAIIVPMVLPLSARPSRMPPRARVPSSVPRTKEAMEALSYARALLPVRSPAWLRLVPLPVVLRPVVLWCSPKILTTLCGSRKSCRALTCAHWTTNLPRRWMLPFWIHAWPPISSLESLLWLHLSSPDVSRNNGRMWCCDPHDDHAVNDIGQAAAYDSFWWFWGSSSSVIGI